MPGARARVPRAGVRPAREAAGDAAEQAAEQAEADAAAALAGEQAEEGITAVRRVPWSQVLGMVADGTITDGETVASLMYAAIALGRVA
ncbi:hypothetical protein [Cellulomonas sp. ATA003]|uniref:hypothetical protein n=1 Tax=Cellulomonas sp. ATA003 TaxID=3073064 RepID=UPI002872C001|nr:hypothetical protein [Cellulomonas sp. ATA003]WNB87661.1 hypothetical protein REH70_02175 [Cellulomonas sp. ATA003]